MFGAKIGAEVTVLDDHAKYVFEGEVGLLNIHGRCRGDDGHVIAEAAHGTAAVASETNSRQTQGSGSLESADDVLRIT